MNNYKKNTDINKPVLSPQEFTGLGYEHKDYFSYRLQYNYLVKLDEELGLNIR